MRLIHSELLLYCRVVVGQWTVFFLLHQGDSEEEDGRDGTEGVAGTGTGAWGHLCGGAGGLH